MDTDAWELPESRPTTRSFKDGTKQQTREFMATGVSTPEEAESLVLGLSTAPTLISGTPPMIRQAATTEPITDEVYKVSIPYESIPNETNQWTFSGTTSGATQKVTQSFASTRYPSTGVSAATDYKGAINVTDNGVEGVDIVVPKLEFQISKTLASGVLTLSYVATLVSMTGTTNNATWNGFNQGELLFLGAEFSQKSEGEVTVTYKFVASPNQTGLTFGTITGVAKKGHEYLWIEFAAKEDSGRLIRTPKGVYVERVYKESDFTSLGI